MGGTRFMLTFGQLKDEARHALGGDPDARINLTALVNGACARVYHARPWAFRSKMVENLAATASQGYITLPTDFDQPNGIPQVTSSTGGWSRVEIGTPQDILRRRSVSATTGGTIIVAFGTYTDAMVPNMLVWPTPAADGIPTFAMTYVRKWVNLTTDNQVPPLPDVFEEVLVQYVRATIKGREDDNYGNELARYDSLLDALWREDAGRRLHVSSSAGVPSMMSMRDSGSHAP